MSAYDVINAVNDIVPAWLVGGAVRDTLMHKAPKDWDFATHLPPNEVKAKLKAAGRRVYEMGAQYGTIGAKVSVNGEFVYVEITTYRTEDCTNGGRHPSVSYVDCLEADLARRDFTINAIAARYDHNMDGLEFCDPYDGRSDIRHQTIKAVGTPWRRFTEDPLRILRMYRFASQLGFSIEDRTRKQAAKNAHRLLTISKERIVAEMDKILLGNDSGYALECMMADGVFRWFLPELQVQYQYDQHSPYHSYALGWHTILTVTNVNNGNAALSWAALLHDVGKPFVMTAKATGQQNYVMHEVVGADMAEGIARRLKFSNERRQFVVNAIAHHMDEDSVLRDADRGAQ